MNKLESGKANLEVFSETLIELAKKDKNIIYINFEDRKLWPLTDKTLDELLNFIYEEERV